MTPHHYPHQRLRRVLIVPDDLWQYFTAAAATAGMSASEFFRHLLRVEIETAKQGQLSTNEKEAR